MGRIHRRLAVGLFALGTASLALLARPPAAYADFGSRFAKVGDWVLYKRSDAAANEPHCIGLYKDRAQVQLTPDALAFYFGPLGVQAYVLRWGNAPATPAIQASDAEKQAGVVLLKTERFSKEIFTAQWMYLDVLTRLKTIVELEVDLSTTRLAVDAMTKACPP
jgi:hypothetical protein